MPGTKPGHDEERVTGHGEVSQEAAAIIGRAEERSPNRESPSSSSPGFVPAIHVLAPCRRRGCPGRSPGMTWRGLPGRARSARRPRGEPAYDAEPAGAPCARACRFTFVM